MIDKETRAKFRECHAMAMTLAPSVGIELGEVDGLVKVDRFTEATLRLGRATEAVLYCIAKEAEIPVSEKVLKDLVKIKNEMDQYEREILQSGEVDKVKQLSNISKKLSEAISDLTENEDLRTGIPRETSKRPNALLRELRPILAKSNPRTAKRLKVMDANLSIILSQRNNAAPASPEGKPREIDVNDFNEVFASSVDLIQVLMDSIIAIRLSKPTITLTLEKNK